MVTGSSEVAGVGAHAAMIKPRISIYNIGNLLFILLLLGIVLIYVLHLGECDNPKHLLTLYPLLGTNPNLSIHNGCLFVL